MASIKDVAKLAGVSIATVSRYLSDPESIKEKNRIRVEQAVTRTGYAPNTLAQNFRRGKTGLVMVVLSNVGDPFFTGVMTGISRVADSEGYSLLIREMEMNTLSWDQYSAMVLSKQADGIILLASICPLTPASSTPAGRRPAPIVLGCENVTPELGQFPSVRIDNVKAAREGAAYLIEQGHRQIAFISGIADSMLTADRERGYRLAMAEAGLPVGADWVVEGRLSIACARSATRQLLQLDNAPTALFCGNDEMAIGAIHEIKACGMQVPGDVSVLGFDDIRYAEVMDPPLTTIAQPAEQIGERTMKRLLRAIEGQDIGTEPEIVKHKLIVRESTGPVS